jgi:AraC-like DNA-binding protein
MGFALRDCLTPQERRLKNIVILHLSMTCLTWFTIFCYLKFPEVFIFLTIPCLAGFILVPVFFYRIIRLMTRMEQAERFPVWHYLAPVLIGLVFLLCSLIVPLETQLTIAKSQTLAIDGKYAVYSRLFTSHPFLRMAFIAVYYGFIARLLVRYYRRMNESDIPACKPARWIVFLIAMSLAFVISSITSALMTRNTAAVSVWSTLASVNISGQMIVLTFHIICRKYMLYVICAKPEIDSEAEVESRKSEKQQDASRLHAGKPTRLQVDNYFRKQKPYLLPGFKITDLAKAMDVNRSVMSDFINKMYGVNFNRFVNQWRLRELERLQALPSNRGRNVSKLFAQAGFAELRQYYRAKNV